MVKFKKVSIPLSRPIVLLAAIGLLIIIVLGVAWLKPATPLTARQSADKFLYAYETCDATTARDFYTVFQSDKQAFANYQKGCVKGMYHFTYSGEQSYPKSDSKTARLIYDVHNRQKQTAQFLLTLSYDAKQHDWLINSVTPASKNNIIK